MAENAAIVSDLVYTWFESRLPETLLWDQTASQERKATVIKNVQPVMVEYKAGVADLAPGGEPLDDAEISLLKMEYDAWVEHLGAREIMSRSFATLGMYLALAVLCGFYIYHRRPALLTDFRQYATLIVAGVGA